MIPSTTSSSQGSRFLWLLLITIVAGCLLLLMGSLPAAGWGHTVTSQGSAFLYQGLLNYQGAPANGDFDFAFRLYDGPQPGIDLQVGNPVTLTNVAVTNGVFTATLDFGAQVFDGNARWLETQVRAAGTGSYVALRPIEPLTAVPYALNALNGPNISLVLNGTTLELTDATGTLTATLSSLQDGVDDADNDPANELNTGAALSGTQIFITDTGGTLAVDLDTVLPRAGQKQITIPGVSRIVTVQIPFNGPFAVEPAVTLGVETVRTDVENPRLTGVDSAGFTVTLALENLQVAYLIDGRAADVGQYTSLAVTNGNPAISYHDMTNGDLKYAAYVGSSGNCGPANTWQCDTIDPANGGIQTSLAFNGGNPAISYHDGSSGDLKYAAYVGSSGNCGPSNTWQCDVIDTPNSTAPNSLAFIGGNPAIAYQINPASDLKYASYVGSGGNCGPSNTWQCDTIDSSNNKGSYVSIAVVGGNPAIAYRDSSANDLKYATYVGGGGNCGPSSTWQCDIIDPDYSAGHHTSLAVIGGNPAMSYRNTYTGDLRYAVYVGSGGNCGPANTWQCDTIDSSADVGTYTSLAGVGGNPVISYHDVTNADLNYAVYVGSGGDCGPSNTWQCSTVDSVGDVGTYTSLAELGGLPAISYYDATNGDLKYAVIDTVTVTLHWSAAVPR